MNLDDMPELTLPTLRGVRPENPANVGYPATLPLEIAMRTSTPKEICKAYGISRNEWDVIRHDKVFKTELSRAQEMLSKEGVSFKIKAKMQSDELLKTSWKLIHDHMVPPNVRADLIKATVRWAGYDTPAAAGSDAGNGFSISINFNGAGRNAPIQPDALTFAPLESI